MHVAAQAVLNSYADRPWCSAGVRRRLEGRVAWDDARAALADSASRPRTLATLAVRLASPARMAGVAQTLVGRHAVRRLTARQPRGGHGAL
jgi:hypothetical protein